MKNKIKKILFSGILSLVLVFAFAFASLNVLRTDDRAHAGNVFCYFRGTLYLPDNDKDGINIDMHVVLDEDITIGNAKVELSNAIKKEYKIAVAELSFGDYQDSAKLNTVVGYSSPISFEGTYGPITNNQNTNLEKKIEFTTVPYYDENSSQPNYRNASGEGANDSFLVTNNLPTFYIDYNVTYNDGVNSLLLLPTFDKDFFEIKDVKVYNETAGWEEATITKDGFDRILLEGSALFSNSKAVDSTEAPVTLLRIKFATKKVEGITGLHAFGLDLAKNGNDQNTYSQAFKWLDGTKLGEQEEVQVVVNNAADANQVRFFEMQTPRMEIKTNSEELLEEEELTLFYEDEAIHYLEFTYEGSPVTTKLNKFTNLTDFNDALEEMETPNLRVDYLYYGASTLEESNVIVNWYNATLDYSEEKDRVVKGDPINNLAAPTRPGWYVVEITVPQTGTFSSITKTGIIHIKRATLIITLENKTSAYGTSLAPLTYMYGDSRYNSGEAFTAPNSQNIIVNLSTTATSSSNVGPYEITASVSSPYYNININTATYTITARKITVRVEQGTQEVNYTGSEPAIEKGYNVYYAVVGNEIEDGDLANTLKGTTVTLELVPYTGVSKWNVGFYDIQAKLNSENYQIVDQTKGTLQIKTLNYGAEDFDDYFAGLSFVYDGTAHELLSVDTQHLPTYLQYTPQSFVRTNAGNYNIAVTLTLSEQDAANYTNGNTSIQVAVVGTISKRDIYVKAIAKSSYYREPRAELIWVLDNDAAVQDENNNNPGNNIVGTDSLGFTLFVREGQTAVDVPHANAGTYTIDFNGANPNYNIHKTTATYTINRIAPQIAINAANVNYNRPLSISAKVNGSDYAYVVKKGKDVQDLSTVLDAGEYTVVVSYAQTTNYNALEETRTFTISKVDLKAPTVTYSGKTATWTAVTTDAVENDNKELYNAPLTYTVTNGFGTISESTYTAVAADKGQQLTLHVASSNANYNAVDVNLNAVYEVTFAEGSHEFNTAHATPMPASQLLFAGQKATAPTSNPALDGYTFAGWYLNDAQYGFASVESGVTANIELVAHWGTETYTVKVSIRKPNGEVEEKEYEVYYNQELGTTVPNLAESIMILNNVNPDIFNFTFPSKEDADDDEEYTADDYGKIFGFDTWMIDNEPKTSEEVLATKVTGDINLTIRYKVVDYVEFTVTYYIRTYVSNGNEWNTDYPEAAYSTGSFKYGTAITYETLVATPWFASDVWYLDEARNIPAPATMPNEHINVYGAYVFDIGNGDVDASKTVSTDDIQVYREWIVGGYTISDISVDGTLPAAKEFDNNNKYFLRLVADVNGDNSFDIRDVSTIRMTLVQNYGWDKETGYNVSGNEVVRNVSTDAFADISTALQAGNKVTLSGNVTAAESALALSVAGNVTLDLNGKTLTVAKVDLTVTNRGTLTVKNGTIVTTQGITLRAPYGNVTIDGVNGFDANGAVNLQAAEHSLHLAGKVGFYQGTNTAVAEPTPAAVKVAQNTHVVLESAAELVVEKLVVAKVETTGNETVEFTVPTTQEDLTEEYTISIENNTVNPTVVAVEGFVDVETNEIKTFEQLVAAGQKGGIYTLGADIDLTAQVVVSKALVLDLNGHTLSNTSDLWDKVPGSWSLISVQKGGDLTIGNGTLDAKENDCYAVDVRYGANLVIENGTFVGNITAVYAYEGTVTINGGHFSIKQLANNATDKHRFTLNLYDANRVAGTATIVVNGGEFENFNPSNNLAEGPKTNFVAAGYVVSASNNVYTVTAENETVKAIASVDDLIDAITNGGNYVLMADVVYGGQASFAHNTTIELNGYKLQSTNDVALSATDGATLTLNGDGEVEAQEACVMAFDASHVVINGGTYTAHDNFVLGTNGSTGRGENTITVNAGTFNGGIQSAGYVACGIYVANSDTVVVNAGTFNVTNGVGILARSGNTTVANGVVFNVTGDGHLGKVGDSQVTVPAGAVLVLDLAAGYPGGVPTLTNNTNYEVVTIANDIVNINNLAQLKAFRDDVNAGNNYAGKTVVLNANITLDGAWTAISNYSRKDSANESKWFAGTFDGRGHEISGLTNNSANIVEKEEFTYGLFGSVKNAVIKNLTLANVNISTNKGDSLGALVGYYAGSTQKAEANISNITVSGTVAGADNVGGVVGRAAGDYFKAENVTVNGTVTALKKAAGVVGTGNAHEMVFVKCVNHAAVSSTASDSNQGYNTVAGISITWKGQDDQHPVCTKVVLTNCSNDGALSTCNTSSLAGKLAVDYSPKTKLDSNGTWTYANGHWTCEL